MTWRVVVPIEPSPRRTDARPESGPATGSDPDRPLPGWPANAVRCLLAVLAWWGLLAALGGDPAQLKYFSQVTTLTVALTATAAVLGSAITGAGWARAMAWCRGASTTYAAVTAVIYQTLLSGDLAQTSSLLEHAVVPALAVLDWVAFGPGPIARRQRWWLPLTWLLMPICYLGVYDNVRTAAGRPLYPFLDPDAGGRFWTWVGIMLLVFAVVGFLVWAVGRLRARMRA